VVFAVGRTLALGRTSGLITVVGNALGTSAWLVGSAFGFAALLVIAPWVLLVVKIAGALYLGYLGFQTIRKSGQQSALVVQVGGVVRSPWQTLREGFLVGIGNPKVAVFFLAVLPQFINPAGNFTAQFLLLGLGFEILGTIGDASYVLGAALVRNWILTEPRRLARIVAVGGFMIIGVSLWMLFNV
jgi:hypothetical protein